MSYQVFTEVTADLGDEVIAGMPGLHVIPMNVHLGEKDYLFGPGGDLGIKDFYTHQRNGEFASTSQITPFAYREQFIPVLEAGEDILYLCFSSGLSDTIQAARTCAAELMEEYPDRRILVIDTLDAAVGQGLLVCDAMKLYADGMGIDEVAAWAEERKHKVCHWFTVDMFDHLLHGGRVSATSAKLGGMLNIKPFLHLAANGKLEVMGKPRGRKTAMRRLLEKIKEGWRPDLGKTVLIGHGDCPEAAESLKAQILAEFPDADVIIEYIDPVIGAHTGPDIMALIYYGDNR